MSCDQELKLERVRFWPLSNYFRMLPDSHVFIILQANTFQLNFISFELTKLSL